MKSYYTAVSLEPSSGQRLSYLVIIEERSNDTMVSPIYVDFSKGDRVSLPGGHSAVDFVTEVRKCQFALLLTQPVMPRIPRVVEEPDVLSPNWAMASSSDVLAYEKYIDCCQC